eukprot:jgi/Mesen1/9376/ME000610S08677
MVSLGLSAGFQCRTFLSSISCANLKASARHSLQVPSTCSSFSRNCSRSGGLGPFNLKTSSGRIIGWTQHNCNFRVSAEGRQQDGHSSEVPDSREYEVKTWTVGDVDAAARARRQRNVNVVLVSPLIPGNVGSIARTCAATCVGLHLVQPLGFQIDDAKLKRAGLDYWPHVVVKVHESWEQFVDYFLEQEIAYASGDWLVFGSETTGLPADAIARCLSPTQGGGLARIPINESFVRSLNLSVSVGIGLYEAIRQLDPLDTEIGKYTEN